MTRRPWTLPQLLLTCIALAWSAALLAVLCGLERQLEVLLEPWFAVCRWATPQAWQVRGNAPLGLGWLVIGVSVYGAGLALGIRIALGLTRARVARLLLVGVLVLPVG